MSTHSYYHQENLDFYKKNNFINLKNTPKKQSLITHQASALRYSPPPPGTILDENHQPYCPANFLRFGKQQFHHYDDDYVEFCGNREFCQKRFFYVVSNYYNFCQQEQQQQQQQQQQKLPAHNFRYNCLCKNDDNEDNEDNRQIQPNNSWNYQQQQQHQENCNYFYLNNKSKKNFKNWPEISNLIESDSDECRMIGVNDRRKKLARIKYNLGRKLNLLVERFLILRLMRTFYVKIFLFLIFRNPVARAIWCFASYLKYFFIRYILLNILKCFLFVLSRRKQMQHATIRQIRKTILLRGNRLFISMIFILPFLLIFSGSILFLSLLDEFLWIIYRKFRNYILIKRRKFNKYY